MKLYLIIIGLLGTNLGLTQCINVTQELNEASIGGYTYVLEGSNSELTAHQALKSHWTYLHEEEPAYGYVWNYWWQKFEVCNPTNQRIEKVIYIPFNHIKEIRFFLIEKGQIVSEETAGTTQNAQLKKIAARGHAFRIIVPAGAARTVLIRFDHRMLPLRASTWVFSNSQFQRFLKGTDSYIGFWRGFATFALILSLVLYLSLKMKMFLYYFLFNLFYMGYMATELGDYFHFFQVDKLSIIADIDHTSNMLLLTFLPLLINELIPIKKTFKVWWKVMFTIIIPSYLLVPIGYLPILKGTYYYLFLDIYMAFASSSVFLIQVLLLFLASIKRMRNAKTLFATYSFFVLLAFLNVLIPVIGLKASTPNVNRDFLTGSIIEIFTFLLLMGRESLSLYKERTLLVEKQKKHQEEMLEAVVESQENERNRVGKDLHDIIGANLSIIKQHIPKNNTGLRILMQKTIDSVRDLSHGLVTPKISQDEFIDEITELCMLASNEKLKISPLFHNWEVLSETETQVQFYRIVQELIQNAIKHSLASEVFLHFSQEERYTIISYEDNGVGFEFNKARNKGVGLKNIENRVELLKGSMSYSSNEHEGSLIRFQFSDLKLNKNQNAI